MFKGDWFVSVNNINEIFVILFYLMFKRVICEYFKILLKFLVLDVLVFVLDLFLSIEIKKRELEYCIENK